MIKAFIVGSKKGWDICINNIIPYAVLAYMIIYFLQLSGILENISNFAEPIMKILNLPGVAITVVFTAVLSASAAVGVIASLLSYGFLNNTDVTILMVIIFLGGNQVQNIGRVLGVIDLKLPYYVFVINTCICLFISILLMNLFLR